MYSTLTGIRKAFREELGEIYESREVDSLFYRVVKTELGLERTEVVLHPNHEIEEDKQKFIQQIVTRLKNHEPVQYVLNEAFFLEHSFYVEPSVLIPRPETEELVQLILNENDGNAQRVLDIGTGSGAIAVSLAVKRPSWSVLACDVSNEALIIARRNAREIAVNRDLVIYREDILNPSTEYVSGLDIIVSNPPYVLDSDKQQMAQNVLEYEPHLALFVDDSDPLLFYRHIIQYGQKNLKTGGRLYFEIHEDLSDEVCKLMETHRYEGVKAHLDLQGKKRMVLGRK